MHHGKVGLGKNIFHEGHVSSEGECSGMFSAMGMVLGGINADGIPDRAGDFPSEDWVMRILLSEVFGNPFKDGYHDFFRVAGGKSSG